VVVDPGAGFPAFALRRPECQVAARRLRSWVVVAKDSFKVGEEGGEQVASGRCVAGLAGPECEVATDPQRVWVVVAKDSFHISEEGGEQVASSRRIPALTGPLRQVAAGH
jgi:hypothetical protein